MVVQARTRFRPRFPITMNEIRERMCTECVMCFVAMLNLARVLDNVTF